VAAASCRKPYSAAHSTSGCRHRKKINQPPTFPQTDPSLPSLPRTIKVRMNTIRALLSPASRPLHERLDRHRRLPRSSSPPIRVHHPQSPPRDLPQTRQTPRLPLPRLPRHRGFIWVCTIPKRPWSIPRPASSTSPRIAGPVARSGSSRRSMEDSIFRARCRCSPSSASQGTTPVLANSARKLLSRPVVPPAAGGPGLEGVSFSVCG